MSYNFRDNNKRRDSRRKGMQGETALRVKAKLCGKKSPGKTLPLNLTSPMKPGNSSLPVQWPSLKTNARPANNLSHKRSVAIVERFSKDCE